MVTDMHDLLQISNALYEDVLAETAGCLTPLCTRIRGAAEPAGIPGALSAIRRQEAARYLCGP